MLVKNVKSNVVRRILSVRKETKQHSLLREISLAKYTRYFKNMNCL